MSNIALVGNPNVGKSAVFNALTGLNQSTGNYPGVTIDRKRGRVHTGEGNPPLTLVDLPGVYSLAAHAPDEMIVVDVLLDQQRGEHEIDGLLVVLTPQSMTDPTATAEELVKLKDLKGKPVLASWMGGSGMAHGETLLNNNNIPTFSYPDDAARVFNYM